MEYTLVLLAAGLLGLSAGALWTEAGVLVPFWRSLEPSEFMAWYRRYGEMLPRFFGPLEVGATVAALAASLASYFGSGAGFGLHLASFVLAVAVLLTFPVYFEKANAGFSDPDTDPSTIPAELERWSAWHIGRTVVATAAFGASIAGAMG